MMSVVAACLIALPGPVVEPFAPIGRYAGHWGVDAAVVSGSDAVAPVSGRVTFAGSVAGVRTVTILHGISRVSISYLVSTTVEVGDPVERGQRIGRTGLHGGRAAVHISVRRGGTYVDPQRWACAAGRGGGTLRLLPPMLAELVEART